MTLETLLQASSLASVPAIAGCNNSTAYSDLYFSFFWDQENPDVGMRESAQKTCGNITTSLASTYDPRNTPVLLRNGRPPKSPYTVSNVFLKTFQF